MLFSTVLEKEAIKLVNKAKESSLKVATAESCTGGLLAALITEVPGSSSVFDSGMVTYSNRAKVEQLAVPSYFIEEFSAVSRETAVAMAEGLLLASCADLGVSITGIAGPGGGSEEKPIGTVYIAVASRSAPTVYKHFLFSGSRHDIRLLSIQAALKLLMDAVNKHKVYK